jgi:RNA polymerase sigma-70 factor (ECF subfamily)
MAASADDDALATAHAAWPDVALDPARFAAFLAERAGATHVADLYLVCAAADGLAPAVAAFDRLLVDEVGAASASLRASASSRDEAAQALRALLFLPGEDRAPAILGYAGRGPLRGWLRITATRQMIRAARRGLREVAFEDHLLDAPAIADDPALAAAKARYRAELADAFREALATMTPKDRVLLRFQLVDALSIDEIGAIHGVHRATAARWLVGIRERLVARTHELLAARLSIDTDDVESIVRLVQSQLDVSVIEHLKR